MQRVPLLSTESHSYMLAPLHRSYVSSYAMGPTCMCWVPFLFVGSIPKLCVSLLCMVPFPCCCVHFMSCHIPTRCPILIQLAILTCWVPSPHNVSNSYVRSATPVLGPISKSCLPVLCWVRILDNGFILMQWVLLLCIGSISYIVCIPMLVPFLHHFSHSNFIYAMYPLLHVRSQS